MIRREELRGWPVYVLEPLGATQATPRLLYLHGGAYINEITRSHWSLTAGLSREVPCRCLVPIYPLGASAGAAQVAGTATEIAAALLEEPGDLILAGDSAGGGLALAASLGLRDRGLRVARLVLLSPWLDVAMNQPEQLDLERRDAMLAVAGLREAARTYARGLPLDDPRISPLHGDLRDLPAISVFTGTHDILNPDAHRLLDRCAQAGTTCELIEAPAMPHVYPLMPTPEGRQARRQMVNLLRRGDSVRTAC